MAVAPSPPPLDPAPVPATGASPDGATATYAEITAVYDACPLVVLSQKMGAARIECCGAATSHGRSFVKFVVRREAHASKPDDIHDSAIEKRFEGDGFQAYRLHRPSCDRCFFPIVARHGFVPLKAVATHGELHLATLVDDLASFKRLIADLRVQAPATNVRLLTRSVGAHGADAQGRHGHPALDGLTARQREVLESAYAAGYFHGKELDVETLASELGMSVSTYYNHLRLASHKVLEHILGRADP
ncbi:MAG: helix-turn-helix domain-containing protein [Thermoplasmatota archaeon]